MGGWGSDVQAGHRCLGGWVAKNWAPNFSNKLTGLNRPEENKTINQSKEKEERKGKRKGKRKGRKKARKVPIPKKKKMVRKILRLNQLQLTTWSLN